jgi:hypothetical protein
MPVAASAYRWAVFAAVFRIRFFIGVAFGFPLAAWG